MPSRTEMTFAQWPASSLPIPQVAILHFDPLGDGVYRVDEMRHVPRMVDVPEELYLREFMDLETSNEEQVVGFLRQFGFFGIGVDDVGTAEGYRLLRRIEPAIAPHLTPDETMEQRSVLHIDEVRLHILTLRDVIRAWQVFVGARSIDSFAAESRLRTTRYMLSESQLRFYGRDQHDAAMDLLETCLNNGLRPFSAHVDLIPADTSTHVRPRFRCDLYAAMCLQLFNHMLARSGYHVCRNESCGRLFVHQRGRSKTQHRSKGVEFCSPPCAWAQLQRERRRKGATKRQEGSDDATH
jgi:hypothetical protein